PFRQSMGPSNEGRLSLPIAAAVKESQCQADAGDLSEIAAQRLRSAPQLSQPRAPAQLGEAPENSQACDTIHFQGKQTNRTDDQARCLSERRRPKPKGRQRNASEPSSLTAGTKMVDERQYAGTNCDVGCSQTGMTQQTGFAGKKGYGETRPPFASQKLTRVP